MRTLEHSKTTRQAGASRSGSFRPDVQGLRAVAVGLVLLYHAGVVPFSGGYVGVDVFFVISGFLITGHLLTSIERDGRPHFADFYARRARRILPAALVVLTLTALALPIFAPPLSLAGQFKAAIATALYVPNLWFAAQDTDYLADHAASPFQHYWSLGVEEQFYLLWPLALLGLVLLARGRRALVVAGIAGLAVTSFVLGLIATPWNQPLAFFWLPTRAWELLVGGLVAALVLDRPPRAPRWIVVAGGWVGLLAVVAAAVMFDGRTVFPGTAAAVPVLATAAVIYFGSVRGPLGPTKLLSIEPVQRIGLMSYALYLVHWPLHVLPSMSVPGGVGGLPLWQRLGLGIVLAVPAGWLLHRFVEEPTRSPRGLTSRPPRLTLIAAALATVLMTLGAVAGLTWSSSRTITAGGEAPAPPDRPAHPPVATTEVPTNLTPALTAVERDVPGVYDRPGCHLDTLSTEVQDCRFGDVNGAFRVAVFGDSHAAQWLPALERLSREDGDLAIASYTKSSCPAASVTISLNNQPYATCDTWRTKVLATLTSAPADLVVVSSYAFHPLASGATGADRRNEWSVGLRRTIDQVLAAGSSVLVVADTPRFPTAPPICLSSHVQDTRPCAGDPASARDPTLTMAERTVTVSAGAAYVDLTPALCDTRTCPIIVGNLLVYRDVNHLTATFAAYLAPELREEVEKARPG